MTERQRLLEEAATLISTERHIDYGEPNLSFERIAKLWTAYSGNSYEPHDVAVMLALLKIARISTSPNKVDNWVDLAGYAACGGEVRPK